MIIKEAESAVKNNSKYKTPESNDFIDLSSIQGSCHSNVI